MNEKILIFIAFLVGLMGLFALFLLSENLDYNEMTIEKINAEKMQDMVKLEGEVMSVREASNVTFISIKQPSYMDVIVFDNDISLVPGEKVEVIGKGEEYNSKMEVIAHRIRVIS